MRNWRASRWGDLNWNCNRFDIHGKHRLRRFLIGSKVGKSRAKIAAERRFSGLVAIATGKGRIVLNYRHEVRPDHGPDSRSNAGYDQVNIVRKMHTFVQPLSAYSSLTSGSLLLTQPIITLLRARFQHVARIGQARRACTMRHRVVGRCGGFRSDRARWKSLMRLPLQYPPAARRTGEETTRLSCF